MPLLRRRFCVTSTLRSLMFGLLCGLLRRCFRCLLRCRSVHLKLRLVARLSLPEAGSAFAMRRHTTGFSLEGCGAVLCVLPSRAGTGRGMTLLAVGVSRRCCARSSWNRGSMRSLLRLLLGPLWFSALAAEIGRAVLAKEVLPTAAYLQPAGSPLHLMGSDACYALRRASTPTRRGAIISAGLGPCRQLFPLCAPLLLRHPSRLRDCSFGWFDLWRSCCFFRVYPTP